MSHYPDPLSSRRGSSVPRGPDNRDGTVIVLLDIQVLVITSSFYVFIFYILV